MNSSAKELYKTTGLFIKKGLVSVMRTLAKHLLGKRVAGEIGYYKRLKHVEDKLKEIAITIAIIINLPFIVEIFD